MASATARVNGVGTMTIANDDGTRTRDDDARARRGSADGDMDPSARTARRGARGTAADASRDGRRRVDDGRSNGKHDDAREEGEVATDAREVKSERAGASMEPLGRTGGGGRTRAGGAYVPPFKLAQMMRETRDKSSEEYQRMAWDALKKSINGLVNKVNASNVANVVPELFRENLIRGRGLFARSVLKSQMASPQFSGVFAALVAVVNTKFPEIGELVIKRSVLQFRRAYKRNDKPVCVAATRFLAALINQQVRRRNATRARERLNVTDDEL